MGRCARRSRAPLYLTASRLRSADTSTAAIPLSGSFMGKRHFDSRDGKTEHYSVGFPSVSEHGGDAPENGRLMGHFLNTVFRGLCQKPQCSSVGFWLHAPIRHRRVDRSQRDFPFSPVNSPISRVLQGGTAVAFCGLHQTNDNHEGKMQPCRTLLTLNPPQRRQ